jgi:hypothetical protein
MATVGKPHVSVEDCRSNSKLLCRVEDNKLATLKVYRRAKGLCFKCGEKWGHNHRCSTSVPLFVVEEMWALTVTEEADETTEEVAEREEEPNERVPSLFWLLLSKVEKGIKLSGFGLRLIDNRC